MVNGSNYYMVDNNCISLHKYVSRLYTNFIFYASSIFVKFNLGHLLFILCIKEDI